MESKGRCFFIGRQSINQNNLETIIGRLNFVIDKLVSNGITEFVSFGKKGFDSIAAALVLVKRESGAPIRLIMAGPSTEDYLRKRNNNETALYERMLKEADKIVCKTKNQHLDGILRGAICLCYIPNRLGLLRYRNTLQNRSYINVAYEV